MFHIPDAEYNYGEYRCEIHSEHESMDPEDGIQIYHHIYRGQAHITIADWRHRQRMSEQDFRNYIDCGLPTRKTYGLNGPLDSAVVAAKNPSTLQEGE